MQGENQKKVNPELVLPITIHKRHGGHDWHLRHSFKSKETSAWFFIYSELAEILISGSSAKSPWFSTAHSSAQLVPSYFNLA
jgi:hypothetical protein